ncbi:2-amino-4-hydroxy-6-hydroxymethyldihydropteridine diphosphokinase [Cellulosimicrobium sp. PMB13]|uniref:2-amino-4-hydroxy-6- hydroxymethyldihydropteridine diphosphokinase n=1 Tax=Cellulosimicrobium sp. PMB13 TaxID=3120158 RepID=UPI003F4B9A34
MTTAFAGAVLDADGRPFDRIRLTGLSATGHHGVLEHEKAEGQLFRADVVLHLDTREAARGDDLADTVSYAGVAEDVVAVLEGSPADLVETVAERIAATILTHPDVVAVDVAVHKPQAPITVPFEDVEVVIRRDRVVVPVVAPLARRHDAREAPPVAPIPVGSVAPALIHGVETARDPEPEPVLAEAPAVMPPSIPPASTVERPAEPEPFTAVPDVAAPAGLSATGSPATGASDAGSVAEAPTTAPTAATVDALGHPAGGVPVPPPGPGPQAVEDPLSGRTDAPQGASGPQDDGGEETGVAHQPAHDASDHAAAVVAHGQPADAQAAHDPVSDTATREAPLLAPQEVAPSWGVASAQEPDPAQDLSDLGAPSVPPPFVDAVPTSAPTGHPAPPADEVPDVAVATGPAASVAPDAGADAAPSAEPTPAGPAVAGHPAAESPAAEPPVAVPPAGEEVRERDRMNDVPADFVEVVLALGANLGDAQQTLRDAITDLDSISGLELTEVSPLARTAAVGPEQPDFLNAVVLARTRLSARDLLEACQAVERAHGRVRHERWGPRTLDVDLIVYGSLTAVADDLELPHPRAHERAFVLEPWSQIDPGAVLPGLGGGPVAALAATAPDRAGIRWLALDWLTEGAPNPTGAVPIASAGPASPDGGEPAQAGPPAQVPPSAPTPPPAPTPARAVQAGPPDHDPAVPPAPDAQTGPHAPAVPPAPDARTGPPAAPAPAAGPGGVPETEQPSPFPFDPPSRSQAAPHASAPHATSAPHGGPSTPPSPFPPVMAVTDPAPGPAEPLVAVPVFSPVHAEEPERRPGEPTWRGEPSWPAEAAEPVRDEEIIRGVPFAPVGSPSGTRDDAPTGAPGAAPGPLADPALHQVLRPLTPSPPAQGAAPAPGTPAEPAQPVPPGTEHWSPFPPVSAPPSASQH